MTGTELEDATSAPDDGSDGPSDDVSDDSFDDRSDGPAGRRSLVQVASDVLGPPNPSTCPVAACGAPVRSATSRGRGCRAAVAGPAGDAFRPGWPASWAQSHPELAAGVAADAPSRRRRRCRRRSAPGSSGTDAVARPAAADEAAARRRARRCRRGLERAQAEAERLRSDAAAAREEARAAQEQLGALQRELRRLRSDADRARSEGRRAAEDARASLDAAELARSRAEDDLRRALDERRSAHAERTAARAELRAARKLADVRVRLLLDTIVDAASGLRSELALPPVADLPADLVSPPTERAAARPGSRGRSVDDPALLDELLRQPWAHLVVDGYNVSKTGFGELSLAEQRRRLVDGLAVVAARTGAEVTVLLRRPGGSGSTRPAGTPAASGCCSRSGRSPTTSSAGSSQRRAARAGARRRHQRPGGRPGRRDRGRVGGAVEHARRAAAAPLTRVVGGRG